MKQKTLKTETKNCGFLLNPFLLFHYQLQKQAKINSPAENIDLCHITYQLASMQESDGISQMT